MKTWTFHLRNNAYWHDGVPVTSKDVAFYMDYVTEASGNSIHQQIESIETPDDYTVVVKLKSPSVNFLKQIEVINPAPEHVFKDVSDPKKYIDIKALIGTGPYKLESFDKAAGLLVFKAFDKFWGGKPAIDTIEVYTFKNDYSMIMALEKGEIDIPFSYPSGVSYYYVPGLLKDDDISFLFAKTGALSNVLWLNTDNTPLDDTEFRQALSYAINYEEIKNLFTAGYGSVPDAGYIPEGFLNHIETRKLSFDLNNSKSILDSAGYKDVDGDGQRELPSGQKFSLTCVFRSTTEDHVRMAQMIKKYFADVGVDVTLKPLDRNVFGKVMESEKSYDLSISGTTFYGMNSHAGYSSGYIDKRIFGWSMVDDPEYQAIVDELWVTQDKERVKVLVANMQDYFAEELPQIPLYTMDVIQPYNKEFEGWTYNMYYGVMCNDTFYDLHEV